MTLVQGKGGRRTASALLLSLALPLLSCHGHDTVELFVPVMETGSLDDGALPGVPTPPDTAAGRQLSWLLHVVNDRADQLQAPEIQNHFETVFLRAVPSDDILAQLTSLAREQAPLTFLEVSPDTSDMSLLALVEGHRAKLEIGMNIEPVSGKISGLQFTPVPAEAEAPPASWEAVDDSVAGLAPRAQYLVANVSQGECQSLHARAAEQQLALGSSSVLYVLAELTRQIDAGIVRWDTPVAIDNALKSLPSGELQDRAPGTLVSVREVADKMIAISDNTATDHLIALLGRENVEAGQASAGHQKPELNIPFLTTRELLLFRLELAEAETDAYLLQDVSGRRNFLSDLAGRVPRIESEASWILPRRIEQLEWFASADDLCRLMLSLQRDSQVAELAPLRDILSKNPGLLLDTEEFPHVFFKGGSEPGVANVTWLAERRDGARFFVTIALNDATAPIADVSAVSRIALGIFDLLRISN